MCVSITVQAIAEAIAASHAALTPSQQARVDVLRLMPPSTEIRDLGAWEAVYGEPPSSEPDTPLDILLDEVFEFGRYNLYCKFDPVGTKRIYAGLAEQLRRAGVPCPTIGDFADL